jgi:hypothetical protein
MWFESSPLNNCHIRFRDDDSRKDWIDMAIDEKCIPTLQEICEGEDKNDKIKRKSQEKKQPKSAWGVLK